jgi:hypothetical protein
MPIEHRKAIEPAHGVEIVVQDRDFHRVRFIPAGRNAYFGGSIAILARSAIAGGME